MQMVSEEAGHKSHKSHATGKIVVEVLKCEGHVPSDATQVIE